MKTKKPELSFDDFKPYITQTLGLKFEGDKSDRLVLTRDEENALRKAFEKASSRKGFKADGFAIARLLHEKKMHPEILFAGREQSLTEECRCQKEIDERLGIPVFTEVPDREYTVIIDAVFGVGLSREITGHYRSLIDQLNGMKGRKVAVDIPSGVSSRTGQILGTAFQAELTVSMACVKLGCELFPGKEMAGRTVPVPIGIDPGFFDDRNDVCFTLERECLPSLLPERKADPRQSRHRCRLCSA